MGKFRAWMIEEQQNIQISLDKIKYFLQRNDFKGLSNYTYQSLRTNNQDHEKIMSSYGPQRDKIFNAYASIIASNTNSNGSWAEWYPNGGNVGDKVSKLYFTPGNSMKDMIGLIQGFRALYDDLGGVAKKYQTAIGFKIPTDLWKYLEENDRLVVHLGQTKDPNQKQNFEQEARQVVQNWANQNGIQLQQRTYSKGEDLGNRSFGVRFADTMVQQLQKTLVDMKIQPNQQMPQNMINSVANWYANMVKNYLTNSDQKLVF